MIEADLRRARAASAGPSPRESKLPRLLRTLIALAGGAAAWGLLLGLLWLFARAVAG